MPKIPSDAPVLRAAARWADRCLRRDGSVLTEKSLWTSENVAYLVRYYAENLDEGEGTFLEKLETQLAPAPGSTKQLAAEMLWVMYLFAIPSSMQPATKRRHIRQVWEWSGEILPDAPAELEQALRGRCGESGYGFQHVQVARIPVPCQGHGGMEAAVAARTRRAALRPAGDSRSGS